MFQHNHSEINCLNPSITIIEARPLLFLNWRLIAALCLDYLCLTFHFLLSAKLHIKKNNHEHDCFHTAGVIFLLLLYISSLINSYVLLHIMDKKFKKVPWVEPLSQGWHATPSHLSFVSRPAAAVASYWSAVSRLGLAATASGGWREMFR